MLMAMSWIAPNQVWIHKKASPLLYRLVRLQCGSIQDDESLEHPIPRPVAGYSVRR